MEPLYAALLQPSSVSRYRVTQADARTLSYYIHRCGIDQLFTRNTISASTRYRTVGNSERTESTISTHFSHLYTHTYIYIYTFCFLSSSFSRVHNSHARFHFFRLKRGEWMDTRVVIETNSTTARWRGVGTADNRYRPYVSAV